MTDRYDSPALIQAAPGLTYRRLDLWCNYGLFGDANVQPGSGNQRWFSPADVRVARALVVVSDLGVALLSSRGMAKHVLRDVADALRSDATIDQVTLTFLGGRASVVIDVSVPEGVPA